MSRSTLDVARSVAAVLVSIAVSACVTSTRDPEITRATADEISIAVWGWARPDALASSHCRRFDKEAVFLGVVSPDPYEDTRIVYYTCQWPNFSAATSPHKVADSRRFGLFT